MKQRGGQSPNHMTSRS